MDTLRDRKLPAQEVRAFIAVLRAQDELIAQSAELLKKHGITPPQYNVLRILRGSGSEGAPCGAIAPRMITRVPDVTRLLDRLEKAGLVVRERSHEDRRVVIVRIRTAGLDLLAELDRPIQQLHQDQFRDLDGAELSMLADLLGKISYSGDT